MSLKVSSWPFHAVYTTDRAKPISSALSVHSPNSAKSASDSSHSTNKNSHSVPNAPFRDLSRDLYPNLIADPKSDLDPQASRDALLVEMFHVQLGGASGFSSGLPLSTTYDDLWNGDEDDPYLGLDEGELPPLPPLPQVAPARGSVPATSGSTSGRRGSMVRVEPTLAMLAAASAHGQDLTWCGAPPDVGQGGAGAGAGVGTSSSVNADGGTGYGVSIDEVD
ncbi:hypothetical protein CONPUDRAFT_164506 [Coniophora puteana RWD-64-598 SS2]|uniref:Uncharacterized protein n=1 Tax=Coniophora puteana (strain RWD-64-598) TaxID=741705 RepID=A0A5M3MSI1_CONPW|nr:uncharacterized protein CONPUDRAFT_164506 [Coniophora puteana RWD-64-598 SS2]EIW81704.1 hypothetical protein CONPUDRAFT_164506 [Coniophora puteana RWD-64-598 SS2]